MQTQQLKLSLFQTHLQIFHRMDRLLIVLKQMLFGAGQTLLDQLPTFSSKTMKELTDLYEFRVNSLSLYIIRIPLYLMFRVLVYRQCPRLNKETG